MHRPSVTASLALFHVIVAATVALSSVAHAQVGAIQRGRQFAHANCEGCHSIDRVTPSRLPLAPPFRSLGERYPVESLRESLAEGIVTAHQNMPEFRLEADQIDNFLAFLKSLQRRP